MAHTWDPARYLAFGDERGRPFVDLLVRVGAETPQSVVDLGCGPGNLTVLLARRWPGARVVGIDTSPEMITVARGLPGKVEFSVEDLRDWLTRTEPASVDVLVANATFQWVPGHLGLLTAFQQTVAPGGWFAFQVPGNFGEPSHTIRDELARDPRFAPHLEGVARPASHDPAVYRRVLAHDGWTVDAWETTYLHELSGVDPVFTWVSGTGARPTLQALPAELRPAFEEEYRARLRAAYPGDGGVVILPFRRVFVVARAPA